MSLKSIISKLFTPRPTVNPLYDPSALATTLNVSRVHQIIEAARNGDLADLFTLYRDVLLSHSHIQAEFSKRKLALLGDPIEIQPADPNKPDDVAAADLLRPVLLNTRARQEAMMHLLDSILWPVSVAEKIYKLGDGRVRYSLAELRPVPHHLLDFRKGDLRIYDVDESTGRALLTSQPVDPDRYIVHRAHLLSTADNHGGPMRAVLFWFLFGSLSRDWWARFLDRMGAPFMVGKFPAGDDDARRILQQAFAMSTRIGGIGVSDKTQIELMQAGTATGDNYEKFVALCNREISKLILGQTLSAEAQPTGLGSGVADTHESVRRDIRRVDGERLAGTLRDQLLVQLMAINGLRGSPPVIVWSEDTSQDAAAGGTLLVNLKTAGFTVEDGDVGILNKKFGFRIKRLPEPVAPVLPFAATAVGEGGRVLPFRAGADLGQAAADVLPLLREFPAEAARIIRESSSPAECQDRLVALYSAHDRRRSTAVIADALAVHAAHGAAPDHL